MRVLVIGADGVIGGALARTMLDRGHVVYGTTRRGGPPDNRQIHLDLTSPDLHSIQLPAVDVAFFCAAVTGFAACRSEPSLARQINVVGPTMLARQLAKRGARIVLLSTSAVFDWSEPCVSASRRTCPATVYGALKAEAESEFAALGERSTIVRLTKVLTADSALINGWVRALNNREPVSAFTDLHMAPIALSDATEALTAIASTDGTGIYQLSGASDVSYHEAATYLAVKVGAARNLVLPATASEHGIPSEEIIRFSSLDTSRISALTGWQAPDPYRLVERLFVQTVESGGES